MKTETKKPTKLERIERELQTSIAIINAHLKAECTKCDGTGKPRTKTGEPPKSGHGDAKCGNCYGTGSIGSRLDMIETSIVELGRKLNRLKNNLDAHINKHSIEIKVLPEGHNPSLHGYNQALPMDCSKMTAEKLKELKWKNGWVDYSGRFDLDNDEEMSIVVGKARLHYETYFKDSVHHRNKKFGMFLSSARSGKKLIQEMETGD
jgi:hypothetical protein